MKVYISFSEIPSHNPVSLQILCTDLYHSCYSHCREPWTRTAKIKFVLVVLVSGVFLRILIWQEYLRAGLLPSVYDVLIVCQKRIVKQCLTYSCEPERFIYHFILCHLAFIIMQIYAKSMRGISLWNIVWIISFGYRWWF